MIITQDIMINDKLFVKTYSDRNLYIRKTGTNEDYIEAYDIEEKHFSYEETDILITIDETLPTE